MRKKMAKMLAVVLMLCMLLPQTVLAATTYYVTVSISGPDKAGATQTVSGSSSHYGTKTDKLTATVVALVRSKQSDLSAKFSGTGMYEEFQNGLAAFEGTDAAWTAYVEANINNVSGDFKRVLANKSSTLGDLTVDQANEITYSGYTVTVTLKEYTSGGGSSGGSAGGSSGGSAGGTTDTTTEKNPDGSTTTTTTDETTGTVTETTKTADGSTGTVVTNKEGQVTEASAFVSAEAAKEAAENGEAVTLPVEVPVAESTEDAAAVEISVPKSAGSVKVEVPVENVTPGTVAVKVNPDGTEEIIKTSIPTENGIQLTVEGDATIKIVDNSREFKDVQAAGHWAQDAIDFVTSRELFKGKTEDTFAPEEPTTRAQVMTVLARLDGADTSGSALQKGMEWAVENGVSDGSKPNGTITRQQLATMLYRYAGSPAVEGSLSFPDADGVADYAEAAMLWAVQTGIINGKTDGTLDPAGLATRAQVATMMARYCAELA